MIVHVLTFSVAFVMVVVIVTVIVIIAEIVVFVQLSCIKIVDMSIVIQSELNGEIIDEKSIDLVHVVID
jgi:hypothetical protein